MKNEVVRLSTKKGLSGRQLAPGQVSYGEWINLGVPMPQILPRLSTDALVHSPFAGREEVTVLRVS